jgi:hypothetical protein
MQGNAYPPAKRWRELTRQEQLERMELSADLLPILQWNRGDPRLTAWERWAPRRASRRDARAGYARRALYGRRLLMPASLPVDAVASNRAARMLPARPAAPPSPRAWAPSSMSPGR